MSQLSTQPFFSVADDKYQTLDGPAKNDGELCSGKLAVLNSDGALELAAADKKPNGFVFTQRFLVYAPTSFYAEKDAQVTLLTGNVTALAGPGLFTGGTLPDVGDKVYAAADGLMDTSGTNQVGTVVGKQTVRAVPNTTAQVALIQCRFSGKDL